MSESAVPGPTVFGPAVPGPAITKLAGWRRTGCGEKALEQSPATGLVPVELRAPGWGMTPTTFPGPLATAAAARCDPLGSSV